MGTAEQRKDFLEVYKDYVSNVLQPTKCEVKNILKKWKKKETWNVEGDVLAYPSPISWYATRIKRPESLVDKITSQTDTFPDGLVKSSLWIINDAFACRIIVFCLQDLRLIHDIIMSSDFFDISQKDEPYVFDLDEKFIEALGLQRLKRKGRDTGYTAIHYIVRLKESSVPMSKRPWFEIQVKTLVQHAWSEIEHLIGYKPIGSLSSLSESKRQQFKIISSHLNAIDEHFNLLFEDALFKQKTVKYNSESIITSEALPKMLRSKGIVCSQNKIEKSIRIFRNYGIYKVKDFEGAVTMDRIEIIKNIFEDILGCAPTSDDLIVNLASSKEIEDDSLLPDFIKVQIAYKSTSDKMKSIRCDCDEKSS
ncbi:MAG: hypothetical protein ACL93V_12280 [Candidatus Electrothrix sp. YB6]